MRFTHLGPCRFENSADLLHLHRLELGAGGGLVGLGVALECGVQGRLLVTDRQEMLDLMQHNIRLNDVDGRAKALTLNWCVQLPLLPVFLGN